MEDSYRSLAEPSEGLYKEKGSKFIAHAYPVASISEIENRLQQLRNTYHDARHHCYAYQLKALPGATERYRANDDGEPKHSAGDPILGQIRSANLKDVLVVVIRYFGGTKLGVSGLMNAYKIASAKALETGKFKQYFITRPLAIRFSYEVTNEVMRVIDEYGLTIHFQDFGAACFYRFNVPYSAYESVFNSFSSIYGTAVINE